MLFDGARTEMLALQSKQQMKQETVIVDDESFAFGESTILMLIYTDSYLHIQHELIFVVFFQMSTGNHSC